MKLLPKPTFLGYLEECKRSTKFRVLFILIVLLYYGIATVTYFPFVIASVVQIEHITLPLMNQQLPAEEPKQSFQGLPTPTPVPDYLPERLKIAKLEIDTEIEYVGQTKTLHMDVPKNAAHAAWYVYGAKPGEIGNAVLSGHYDTPTGAPAVFFRLGLLEVGDEVRIVFEDMTEKTFLVTGKERHHYTEFPNEFVFFTKPGRNVNLITCGGIWDPTVGIYNDRLVVFTTLKEG